MKNIQPFKERFIQTNEIRLHYLDWRGSGLPLVCIHGLGASPYIFENIASSLKRDFRIIAYSRRGHCKSNAPNSGYDNSILVSDLKILLDSLKIEKANLLGWSMGGNEITEFAIRYPERTNKLIYLEAGYDYSEEEFITILKNIPSPPVPQSTDLYSLDSYRKWHHHVWFADVDWNPTLESNLKASTLMLSDGSVGMISNDTVSMILLESLMSYRREYDKIQAPALAIYSNQFYHSPLQNDDLIQAYENLEKEIINPWRQRSIERIKKELKNVMVKDGLNCTHTSILFLNKEALVKSITDFLIDE